MKFTIEMYIVFCKRFNLKPQYYSSLKVFKSVFYQYHSTKYKIVE